MLTGMRATVCITGNDLPRRFYAPLSRFLPSHCGRYQLAFGRIQCQQSDEQITYVRVLLAFDRLDLEA